MLDRPAIALEAPDHVLAEGKVGVAFDGHFASRLFPQRRREAIHGFVGARLQCCLAGVEQYVAECQHQTALGLLQPEIGELRLEGICTQRRGVRLIGTSLRFPLTRLDQNGLALGRSSGGLFVCLRSQDLLVGDLCAGHRVVRFVLDVRELAFRFSKTVGGLQRLTRVRDVRRRHSGAG